MVWGRLTSISIISAMGGGPALVLVGGIIWVLGGDFGAKGGIGREGLFGVWRILARGWDRRASGR